MLYFDFASLLKYLLEGIAVGFAAFYIPRRNINIKEVLMISLAAAATFALLDAFAPSVSFGARQGSGFGIGYNLSTSMVGAGAQTGAGANTNVTAENFIDIGSNDTVSNN
jgi:hypothetical protein